MKLSLRAFDLWDNAKRGGLVHDEFLALAVQQMSRVAAMYFAFPSGESFSETSFSYTGRVVSKGRKSMEDKTLENLFLIRACTKQPYYSFERVIFLRR